MIRTIDAKNYVSDAEHKAYLTKERESALELWSAAFKNMSDDDKREAVRGFMLSLENEVQFVIGLLQIDDTVTKQFLAAEFGKMFTSLLKRDDLGTLLRKSAENEE